jgi:1-acyl-sn-glycerol-3-phosphate acyltransferase
MSIAVKRALYGLTSNFVYAVFTWTTRLVVRALARWEIDGSDRVPAEGPVVLVCNHLHLLDPPLVAASVPRRVHTMAKRELFETPLVGWTLWPYGAIPVRRFSADMGALRAARSLLRAGAAVVMFPEGTRSKDARLHPALPGAAMVALLAGAPVLPVAVTGTDAVRLPRDLWGWLRGRRPHVRVTFGEPFTLEATSADARNAEEATDAIMRRVAALLPEQYRGAYGAGSEGRLVFARQDRER